MQLKFRDVIARAIEVLQDEKIDDAINDAWLLSEWCLGIDKHKYYMNMNMDIDKADADKYFGYIKMRASHIPLQHITGVQEFMGLSFKVNENVLVPRQETELLVEKTINLIDKLYSRLGRAINVLDMCTGSGCIAISIDVLSKKAMVDAADISNDALDIARYNCENLGATVNFINSDMFESINKKYDIIVSNPPYIPTRVIEELEEEVKLHDPYIALDGKEDGLYFYRKIVDAIDSNLEADGYVLLEIGHDQGEDLSSMLRKKQSYVKVYKDLAGLDRVVVAGKEEENV